MLVTENSLKSVRPGNILVGNDLWESALADRSDGFDLFDEMEGISLRDISAIRLMDRMDVKYMLPLSRLMSVLKPVSDFYYVQEIDGIRIASYETTYYDYPNLQFFHNHVNGKLNRCKVRERKYVDCDLRFLEVKRKTNKGKTIKNRIKIDGNADNFGEDAYKLIGKYAKADLFLLFPILRNRFKRITLVNLEMTERVTIDFDLQFSEVEKEEYVSVPNIAVVEIKQDKFRMSHISKAMFDARIRKFGISKYCLGVALTGQDQKLNQLKSKLRKIQKMSNYEFTA